MILLNTERLKKKNSITETLVFSL